MYYALTGILILAVILLVLFHWRKKKIIKKIGCMLPCEKIKMLNEWIEPMGYIYDPEQDIFFSSLDAWQKNFGYSAAFDRAAPYLNMIIDCLPVYFDYDGKTWLIEFWKGQYGINTGSEIGVYRTEHIIPPAFRKSTLFQAVEEEDYLEMHCTLYTPTHQTAHRHGWHWWQTIFRLGTFSDPGDLTLAVSLRFPNFEMQNAFLAALEQELPENCPVHTNLTVVSFVYTKAPGSLPLYKRIHRRYVQCRNRWLCRLYCFVTRPMTNTCDKLLYLYEYLPFAFRRTLRLRRFGRNRRHTKKTKRK